MKIVTSETMIHIDHTAQEEFHIPGLILMEQAGIAVCDVLEEIIECDYERSMIDNLK